jgi:hypothetical protein
MPRPLIWLIILVLALVVSCNPDEMTAPGQEPAFIIQDGGHGGNAHFFFLPPLVPRPNYSGTPDGTLEPEVTVCELTSGGSCGPILVRFTTAPGGTILDQVRYDRFTGSYYVVWDTRKCLAGPCALDPAKRYRLKVSVAGAELGWADLDVVAKLRELTGVDWGTDVGVVRELPLPIRLRIEQGGIAVINIHEAIAVNDDAPTIAATDAPPAIPPTVEIAVAEQISILDGASVLPPATISVSEVVHVTDQNQVLAPVSISVEETIAVSDAPNITLQ